MPKKKDYSSYSKEELIKQIQLLEKRKKYGLVWEEEITKEKFEKEAEGKFPVLKEIVSKEIKTDPDQPTHILIEGDNYHALSVLSYTHPRSIDVIYIDPPYNTGNKDFSYNDSYVDKEDTYRHSKWLSFVYKRLKLAKNLLKKTGAIFISIDNNEIAQLKLICDDLFGENNLVGLVTVAKGTTTGQDAKKLGSSADYLLIYGMSDFIVGKIHLSEKDKKRFSRVDKKGRYSVLQWRKTGNGDRRTDRPNLYYSIIGPDGEKVFPKGPTGYDSRWRGDFKRFKKLESDDMIEWIKQGKEWRPYVKYYLEGRMKAPSNLWNELDGNKKATIELKDIFGDKVFQNPKPTDLIKKCINLANVTNPVVLDFFVGSGTTAQAVLNLNDEDGGNRQFIVCTNNENNICSEVCLPRIQRVIQGYRNINGEKIDGVGSGLKYYRTSFVFSESTHRNKKILTDQSTEMLCLKENAFEEVLVRKAFKIFKNKENYLAILFDESQLENFKKEVRKLKLPIRAYVFSLEDDDFTEDFEDLDNEITLCSIPEAILKVYRRIFK